MKYVVKEKMFTYHKDTETITEDSGTLDIKFDNLDEAVKSFKNSVELWTRENAQAHTDLWRNYTKLKMEGLTLEVLE